MNLSNTIRNALVNALAAQLSETTLELRTGGGAVVASFPIPANAWNVAADGVATLAAALPTATAAAGTVATYRFVKGGTSIADGAVGVEGSNADIELIRLDYVGGEELPLNQLNLSNVAPAV